MISTILYFSVFIVSSMLLSIANKIELKKSGCKLDKYKIIILYLLAILVPSIMSGIRFGVGADFFNYQNIYNGIPKNPSIHSFIALSKSLEALFLILILIVKKVFNDIQWMYFLSSFLTMLFLVLGLRYYKEKINIGLAMFIYLITIFPHSFNIIRQCIGVSIIFYCFKYIYEKNILKWIIGIICASLFHKSCFIFIFIYFAYGESRKYIVRRIVLIISLILIVIFYNNIINTLYSLGIIKEIAYTSVDSYQGGVGFLAIKVPFIFLIYLYKKDMSKYDNKNNFYFFIMIVDFILSMMILFNPHMWRVTIVLSIFESIIVPTLIRTINNKEYKILITYSLVFYEICMFIIKFTINNSSKVMPYITIFN